MKDIATDMRTEKGTIQMKDHMKDIAPVIDTHAHLWMDAESRKLDKMAEDGIISQVWIQAHECHRVTETYRSATSAQVLEASRRYPGFILPFGYLNWLKDASQVDRMKEDGYFGLKAIRPVYAYDDERYFPLYERAQELDMPILFHVGTIIQKTREQMTHPHFSPGPIRMRPSMLDTIGTVFPRLRLIQGHMGVPWCNELFESLWYYRRIYCSINGLIDWKWLIDNLDRRTELGVPFHQKMMFGTDIYYGQADPDAIYRAVLFMHEFFRRVGETYEWGIHVRDLMYNNACRFRDEPDQL